VAELHALDRRIEIHRAELDPEVALLLARAQFRGRLEDYQEAARITAGWVAAQPKDLRAWVARTRVLTAIHEFAEARAAVDHVRNISIGDDAVELATAIDEASGRRDRSAPARATAARLRPTAPNLTVYAGSLALEGHYATAIALIPKAAAALRDNSPETLAWMLFQWGRLYEQKGDFAVARAFYQAAHDRMPGYVEANAHLALTMIQSGETAEAKRVITAALVDDRQPALLEIGAQLGLVPVREATQAWERYTEALPRAFADHAARFYLGGGNDPLRALALAQINLSNREVPEARELVVQAALAAADPQTACAAAASLIDAPLHSQKFAAWQAFGWCHDTVEANRLAKELGITP